MFNLPDGELIALLKLEQHGIMKAQTAKSLHRRQELALVKVGKKYFVPRNEILRFLTENMS